MQTETEAPAPEPLSLGRQRSRSAACVAPTVAARRGDRARGRRPARARGRGGGGRRARPAAASRRCSSWSPGSRSPTRAREAARRERAARLDACAYMPQRDLLLPWRDALGNAALALECQGVSTRRGPPPGGAAVRALRPGGVRARPTRPSCPAGCASASRSCARCSPAGRCCCSTSRSRRSTRSRARRCRSGWRARSPAEPRTVRARDARRRGGAVPRRPGGGAVAAAGPRRGGAGRAVRAAARAPRDGHRRPRSPSSRQRALEALAAMRRYLPRRAAARACSSLAWQGVASLHGRGQPHAGLAGRDLATRSRDDRALLLRQRVGDARGGAARPRDRRSWPASAVAVADAPVPAAARRRLPAAGRPPRRSRSWCSRPCSCWRSTTASGPKLAIVALICFFPITVNVLDGLRSVDPELLKLMRTLRRLAAAHAASGRAAVLAAVLLQRAEGGRHGVGDRRGVRRVGGRRRGPRPARAARQQPAPDARACTRAW